MALPGAYAAALARDAAALDLWVEIEGLPVGFGRADHDAAWFGARVDRYRRVAVRSALTEIPSGISQEASPLDGETSVGSYTLRLVDNEEGELLQLVASTQRRDGWVRLTADMAADGADRSIAVSGDPSAFPTAGGVLYLGRETLTYASRSGQTFSGCKRGMYQLEGLQEWHAHTAGDVVSPYPRFAATRRAIVYATLDGTEQGKAHRYSGVIAGAPALTGLASFELRLDTIAGELKKEIFGDQIRGRLLKGLGDASGAYSEDKDGTKRATYHSGIGSDAILELDPDSISGAAWTHGRSVIVRVEDEYLCGRLQNDPAHPETAHQIHFGGAGADARGLFGSVVAEHQPNAEVREVLYTGKGDPAGPTESRSSPFVGDHPLELFLQLALSRDGNGANGPWDVLPGRRTIGMDQARVDVAGILALRDTWLPGIAHRERIEDKFDLKSKLAAILKPVLCYPVQLSDGRLSVRRLSSAIPGLSLRQIVASDVVAAPSWEANFARVYGRVIFRCDYDPTFQATGNSDSAGSTSYRQTFTAEIQGAGVEAQEFYAGAFQTHTVESEGQYTGLAGLDTGAADIAIRLFEGIRDRYSHPPPIIGLQLMYDAQDVEIGDLVQVTLPNVPNVLTGGRGLSGSICEVLGRQLDDKGAVVALTVAQTDMGVQQRLLPPSGVVASWDGGFVVGLQPHAFTDPAGAATDASAFAVGDHALVLSPDLGTVRGDRGFSIAAIDAASARVTLSQNGGTSPTGVVAGDVVVLASYRYQPAARRARSAFGAAAAGLDRGDGTFDPPHEYAT